MPVKSRGPAQTISCAGEQAPAVRFDYFEGKLDGGFKPETYWLQVPELEYSSVT